MPQIKPPIITPIPDIALFAKAYFNIDLTSFQLEVIDNVARGMELKPLRLVNGHAQNTANKVIRAYLKEGLRPNGRARIPQHHLPPREKIKGVTQEGKVLALIKRSTGAFNFELSRVALKYTSVISDLRKDGHDIIADRQYLKNGKASNTWKYRIAGQ